MREWTEVADAVAQTRSTSAKVGTVASYLRALPPTDLQDAVVFLSGRPFPERDPRTTGLGWVAIARAAEEVAGPTSGGLGAAYDRSSDLGTAVGDLLGSAGHRPHGGGPGVAEVRATFDAIADARGPAAKSDLLRRLL